MGFQQFGVHPILTDPSQEEKKVSDFGTGCRCDKFALLSTNN
jgi:hypothetical protein